MYNKVYSSVPKCELPKLIIRHNIGPISAAKSRLFLLGQCHRFRWSSAGPTISTLVHFLNLTTFSRNLAQYRPYTKPIVSTSESRKAKVRPMVGILLGHVSLLPRQTILDVRKSEIGILATELRQHFNINR